MPRSAIALLPTDRRARQGGWLFLGMLLIFFLTSLLLYALYVGSRRDDPLRNAPLPTAMLVSTAALIVISLLVHAATRTVRRDRTTKTALLLAIGTLVAIGFLAIQVSAMMQLLRQTVVEAGSGRGVAGMVVVLAFLHALHVAGGVVALGVVAIRSGVGKYDHERYFAVDFTAHYWHFLDLVWLAMLAAFWGTTGGF